MIETLKFTVKAFISLNKNRKTGWSVETRAETRTYVDMATLFVSLTVTVHFYVAKSGQYFNVDVC